MTKLLEWISVAAVIGTLWISAYLDKMPPGFCCYRTEALWGPVVLVILFGVYSVLTIMYRVATFNDCEDAAKELQKQISEAREDLRSKGFNFEDKPDKKTD